MALLKFTVSVALAVSAQAAKALGATDNCVAQMRIEASNLIERQDQTSRAYAPGGIPLAMRSQLRIGTSGRAVLALHGLIASPFEIETLIDRLEKNGDTVWAPLVYGFGANAALANATNIDGFRQTVTDGLDLLAQCYPKVGVTGFSWGGSLTADALLAGPIGPDGNYLSRAYPGRVTTVTAAVLMAPYFAPWISNPQLLALVRKTAQWKTAISLSLAGIFGSNDLRAPMLYPSRYLQEMPLQTVITVLDFSAHFFELAQAGAVSRVPTLLAYNENDRTVDWQLSRSYVAKTFARSSELGISESEMAPHQILIPTLYLNWKNPIGRIAEYLETH